MSKPLNWFVDRINKPVYRDWHTGGVVSITATNYDTAVMLHKYELEGLVEYRDTPENPEKHMPPQPTAVELDRQRTHEAIMARPKGNQEPVTVISEETLGAMAEADPTLPLD